MLSGNDAWGRNQLARRQNVQLFSDQSGYLASPEDVMLGKMMYYREGGSEKHLRDITGILRMRSDTIDHDYVAVETIVLSDQFRKIRGQPRLTKPGASP